MKYNKEQEKGTSWMATGKKPKNQRHKKLYCD